MVEIAQIRGTGRFATGLQRFLHRALPLPGTRPFATAEEAGTALQPLTKEIGVARCRAALAALVSEFNRLNGDVESDRDWSPTPGSEEDISPDRDVSSAFVEGTEAAATASASLEFELALDEVDDGRTGRADEDEPESYDISLTETADAVGEPALGRAAQSCGRPGRNARTGAGPVCAGPRRPGAALRPWQRFVIRTDVSRAGGDQCIDVRRSRRRSSCPVTEEPVRDAPEMALFTCGARA